MGLFEEQQKRPTENDWKVMRKYIPFEPGEDGLPPEFGYIVDTLRVNYKIYVSVMPFSNEITENTPPAVTRYRGVTVKIEGGRMVKSYTKTGINFIQIMREILNKSIEFIEE